MPTNTYTPLGTITLSASASEVIFSGIPASLNGQSFRDLVVIIAGTSASTTTFGIRFNGDSGNNYTYVEMNGQGSGLTESSAGTLSYALMGRSGSQQSTSTFQLLDYTATDKHKTALARGGQQTEIVRASAARWANTAAITSLTVTGSNWNSGTTMSIYGIAG